MPNPEQPLQIGPYRIVRPLGAGGMGQVYEAVEPGSDRRCAIKTVLADGRVAVDALRALRREVQVLAELDHPHIVKVLDFDLESDSPWFAMEYIEGRPFSEWNLQPDEDDSTLDTFVDTAPKTSRGDSREFLEALHRASGQVEPISTSIVENWVESENWLPSAELRTKLAWLGQVVRALQFLHGLNIVHGDIKPENVLIRADGVAVLVDFGLVSRRGRRITREAIARSFTRAQTLEYAAPERHLKADYDARADLYAVGCMLYEIFAGKPPFTGPPSAVAISHVMRQPPPIHDIDEPPPGRIVSLIERLLRKDPIERIPYALEVCAVLEEHGIPTTAAARPIPPARSYLYQPGFVGFEEQLAEVEAALEAVGEPATSSFVQIVAPSGAGKSRFLLEFASQAVRKTRHVHLISSEGTDEDTLPYGSMRFVLDNLFDRCVSGDWRPRGDGVWLARIDRRLRSFIGPADLAGLQEFSNVPPKAAHRATVQALANALRQIAIEKTIIVIVESLDRLDSGSRAVVDEILRRSGTEAWFVIATTGAELESKGPEATTIELPPLDNGAIATLASQILGGAQLDLPTVQLLRGESHGRPAALVELIHALLDNDLIEQDSRGRWRGTNGEPLSTAARELIRTEAAHPARRVGRLNVSTRRVAEVCSVLGRAQNLNDVLEIDDARVPETLAAINELLGSRLLVQGEFGGIEARRDLAFASAETRRVLYENMKPNERTAVHLAAAEVMAKRGERAMLAHHLERGGKARSAYDVWLEAASAAKQSFAQKLEIRCLEGALRVADWLSVEERENLLVRRFQAICDFNPTAVVRSEAEGILFATTLPVTRAKILFRYVGRMLHASKPEVVTRYLDELNELARSDNPSTAVPANTILRKWHGYFGRTEEAVEAGERAVRSVAGIDNPELELQANTALGNALFETDRLQECLELGEKAIEIAHRTGDPTTVHTALGRVVAIRATQGNMGDVRRRLAPIEEFQRKTSQVTAHLTTLYNIAFAEHAVGRFDASLEALEAMKSRSDEMGVDSDEGEYLGRKATTLALLGHHEEASQLAERAMQKSRSARNQTFAELVHCEIAYLSDGQVGGKNLNCLAGIEPGSEFEIPRRILAAKFARLRGDIEHAREELKSARAAAPKPVERLQIQVEQALLDVSPGRVSEVRTRLESALQWFVDSELDYDAAMVRIKILHAFPNDPFRAEMLSSVDEYLNSQPFANDAWICRLRNMATHAASGH